MDNQNRVLAYTKALNLTNDELANISGGSAKLTTQQTQKITGSYPGTTDVELDQVWD